MNWVICIPQVQDEAFQYICFILQIALDKWTSVWMYSSVKNAVSTHQASPAQADHGVVWKSNLNDREQQRRQLLRKTMGPLSNRPFITSLSQPAKEKEKVATDLAVFVHNFNQHVVLMKSRLSVNRMVYHLP